MRLIATVLSIIIFLSFGCKKDNAVPTQPSNTDSTNIVDSTDTTGNDPVPVKKFRLVEMKTMFKSDSGRKYDVIIYTYNNDGLLYISDGRTIKDNQLEFSYIDTHKYDGNKLVAIDGNYNAEVFYNNDKLSRLEYSQHGSAISRHEYTWVNDLVVEIKIASATNSSIYTIEEFEYISGTKNVKQFYSTAYPGANINAFFTEAKYDNSPSPLSTITGLPEGYIPSIWRRGRLSPNNLIESSTSLNVTHTYDQNNMLIKSEDTYQVIEYKYEEI